ncbi:MAG: hypothetical protein LBM71_03245 [Elusimicrobiota bacterium]|jgi:hypothetical protein|nr:hypothetical protein [Elusimicrobiota bacterium]
MKTQNLVSLVAGIIVAGLLWQYYLKPKYDIKRGEQEAINALELADKQALQEATDAITGEVLFSSAMEDATIENTTPTTDVQEAVPAQQENIDNNTNKDDFLNTRSLDIEEFAFESTANKLPSMQELAARSEKRKNTNIQVEDIDVVMEPISPETALVGNDSEDGDKLSRFTMILAPVKYHLIKTAAQYSSFKKQHSGNYPAVNFKKDMILLLESDGQLSNGFFQIKTVSDKETEILVDYRVNIIGSDDRADAMAYQILPKSNKKITLTQSK